MEIIIPFVSIIGVIIGFLLSTLKESIQNKPKIQMEVKRGNFNYFFTEVNELGDFITKPTHPEYGDFYKVNLQVDIYNYGKGNTAFKNIRVANFANKNHIISSDVILKIKSDQNIDYSFNLPSSNIITMNLEWTIEKDELTESLFNNDLITLPKNKKRIKFVVIATDIKNKKHKIVVEPLSIYTADEFSVPYHIKQNP